MGHWPETDNRERDFTWMCVIIGLVCFVGFLAWDWYSAGVQQEVWARQGCQMSRWEVFMGAKPIERNFVKPEK